MRTHGVPREPVLPPSHDAKGQQNRKHDHAALDPMTCPRDLPIHGQSRRKTREAAATTTKQPTSTPPECEGDHVIPNLRHVANAVSVELHHIDVVRRNAFAGRRHGTTLSGVRAAEYGQSCLKHGVQPEVLTLHSDRWAPMTSQCTAQLLADLGVTRSLSRPQVSDDNPFSEAHFKTLKCHPSFPGRFEDPAQAKTFCRSFFRWYNPEHRHGGISMLTPEQVHFGRADEVIASRKAVLNKAWTTHPERFVSDQHVVHRCARHESRPSRAPVVRISYSILNAVNAWTAPTGSPPPSPEPPQPRGPSWRASWRTTNGRIDPG